MDKVPNAWQAVRIVEKLLLDFMKMGKSKWELALIPCKKHHMIFENKGNSLNELLLKHSQGVEGSMAKPMKKVLHISEAHY